MSLQGLELRLEKMVEGFFARTFRSGVQPVEIARRVLRTLQTQRSTDAIGNRVGPNRFTVCLSAQDHEQLDPIADSLSAELAVEVRNKAAADRIRLLGQPSFAWEVDEDLSEGVFEVRAEVSEGPMAGPLSQLVFSTGDVHPLGGGDNPALEPGGEPCSVGRHASNDVVIDDPNVSRSHATLELNHFGEIVLSDLDSLNGTRLNGARITEAVLAHGDEVTFGSVSVTFTVL